MSNAARSVMSSQDFRQRGYAVLPGLMEKALAEFFFTYVQVKFVSQMLPQRDRQVPNTPAGYGDPAFDGLLEHLLPRIEAHSGLRLLPTYSYFRLYKNGDVLVPHRDRNACEISVSLNIGQAPAAPWPIHIEKDAGPFTALLSPGDALLYRGIECRHWRDAYQGSKLVQVFLHYVDRDGPHAGLKYDGRRTLMTPKHVAATTNAADAE
jgi:hypothetical protein